MFAVNKFFKNTCGLCDNVESNVEGDRPQRAFHVR